MSKIDLNGLWKMQEAGSTRVIEAAVPGTVFSALEADGLIPDPYYRDNEDAVQDVFKKDYEFTRSFLIAEKDLGADAVTLVCEGLDAIADVFVNGTKLLSADNMHRTWRASLKQTARRGENEIRIRFRSTAKKLEECSRKSLLPSILGHTGLEQLRVAQCIFGWDWGLCLPDMGIWRNIYILCESTARLEDLHIRQHHNNGAVCVSIASEITQFSTRETALEITVSAPDGGCIAQEVTTGNDSRKETLEVSIPAPQLWWPNGYGSQPLYQVRARLLSGKEVLTEKTVRIGLKTVTLDRHEDEYGECCQFIINGIPIFMRGSNLIIEDAILPRRSAQRTRRMLEDCVLANFNCVRVWGGSVYPDDDFFHICDELGLLVFQDFMFACHLYPADEGFLANVSQEIKDNVRRLRHHACLGLWCGNNEIETIYGIYTGNDPMTAPLAAALQQNIGFEAPSSEMIEKIQREYLLLFNQLIPQLLAELDPDTGYTRSSPCVKDKPFLPYSQSFGNGDTHIYIYMLDMLPYRKQKEFFFRFVSEMGFQSFPDIKTLRSFTLEEDRSPFSPVILKHQKSANGNQIIYDYLSGEFPVPNEFELFTYASQLTAGEVMKYAVEHMRRNRGRCMGVITWQLNDCWPAISWSGLDYYGRWKAQQYYSKRLYAPILLSADEREYTADLYVSNDTLQPVSGKIRWALKTPSSETILSDAVEVCVPALTAMNCVSLNFRQLMDGFDPTAQYLEYTLVSQGRELAFATTIFTPIKEFRLEDPAICLAVAETENSFEITVDAKAYARSVMLALAEDDCVFSDNYFDVSAGLSRTITAFKCRLSRPLSLEEFKAKLTVKSAYNLWEKE